MMDRAEKRLTLLWCALVGVTLVSWQSAHGVSWLHDHRFAIAGILVLAFIKVRIVILDFMEVRHAPIGLRLALEAWVVLVCAMMIGMAVQSA
jgi:Prokaryotic Cytochrome C oxidase subunit IV